MKFLAYGPHGSENAAVIDGDRTFDLRPLIGEARVVDRAFLEADGITRTRAALDAGDLPELTALGAERRGAPLTPGKILCIDLNYRDHAAETNAEIPAEPIVFMKAADTVVGPDDDVLIPRGSRKTDWEVELGVVIGSTLRRTDSEEEAMRAVAGYVLSHDVSER